LSGKPLVNKEKSEDNEKNSQLLEYRPSQHVKGPGSSESRKSSEGNKTLTRLGIVAVLTTLLLSLETREGRRYAGFCRRTMLMLRM
jgi:hypothetical protein